MLSGDKGFVVSRRFILRFIILLLLAILLLSFLVHCIPESDIRREVVTAFIDMNKSSVATIDSELQEIDEYRYVAEVKLLKLEQVVSPALKWLETQKAREFKTGDWIVRVTPEGLARLKNDQYRVTEVEYYISRAGSMAQDTSFTLKVADLTMDRIDKWEEFKNYLEYTIVSLKQRWQEKLKHRELAMSTLNNLIKNWQSWKVKKINETTYQIAGAGLGWSDKLTTGTWTYYQDKNEVTPVDEPAKSLQKMLRVEF
jgi:hypothetical protein